ncbi:MAG: hypothetical protein C5B53_11140 [Candidatus Melainabacteria bacterium]|nr:MAG: hypothetical protein C5B53_11140 [Candidatus Melainabacteria bacterium]
MIKRRRGEKIIRLTAAKPGSMLLLTCAIGVLLVLGIIAVISFGKFFVHHIHDQSVVDSITLKAATILNADDHSGKINNLVVQSRELVFDSRCTYNATLNSDYWYLEPLAHRLLDQSRWGAQFVDTGRKRLIEEEIKSLQNLAVADQSLKNLGAVIIDLEVGSPADRRSNVYDDEADELQSFDQQKKWVEPETRRFNGNVNANLPYEDHDLTFKISPLQAPSKGKMIQASLIPPNEFEKSVKIIDKGKPVAALCDQLPSAVKLGFAFPDQVSKDYGSVEFKFLQAASTNGAQIVP